MITLRKSAPGGRRLDGRIGGVVYPDIPSRPVIVMAPTLDIETIPRGGGPDRSIVIDRVETDPSGPHTNEATATITITPASLVDRVFPYLPEARRLDDGRITCRVCVAGTEETLPDRIDQRKDAIRHTVRTLVPNATAIAIGWDDLIDGTFASLHALKPVRQPIRR